jgi:hypothetical protein
MAIPGSMVIWMIFLPIYATVAPKLGFSEEYFAILPRLLSSPVFWGMVVILPCVCLIRDFAWKYAKRMYYPQTYHHIQEIQKYNIQDYRPRYVSVFASRGWNSLLMARQNGAIPEGYKKGAAGPKNAKTAWLRVLSSRRGRYTTASSLRYHETQREIRRDAKCGGSFA